MTDNTTNNDETDTDSGSAIVAVDSPQELADFQEEDLADFPEELIGEDLIEIDDDDSGPADVPGSGAVSGGFGIAGLALAIVSLTTNWTGGVVASHDQYSQEVNAPSSGLTEQQQLNMYASAWHTEAVWALAFAAVALVFGAGALLVPWIRHRGGTPGWARATAAAAIIVGLVGLILAVLTLMGVFGGHLTAPASTS